MGNSAASAKSPQDIESFLKHYKKAAVSTSITQVKDGVCHGMCLNWVRKMLVKPDWNPKKDKDYETRGSNLHKGFQDAVLQELKKGSEDVMAAAKRFGEENNRAQELNAKRTAGTITNTEMQELRALIAKIKNEKDAFDTLKATVLTRKHKLDQLLKAEGAWTTEYGAFFHQFRRAGNQKFDALDAAFVDSMGMNGEDEQERFRGYFAAIATHIRQIGPGAGALLNICRKTGSGHFVAFHRSSVNAHWNFYDPNLGWYRCSSVDEVGQLFQDLFLSVYAKFKYDQANWIDVTTV